VLPNTPQLLYSPRKIPIAAGVSFSLAWVSGATDTGGGTTVTYSSLSFGTGDPNRIISAAVVNRPTALSTNTITSMTIGGISATQVSGAYVKDTSTSFIADIWQAAVPTGTSGNVVITYSDASTRSGIDLYSIVTATPTATAAAGAFTDVNAGGTQAVTLTIPTGGAAICIYGNRSTSVPAVGTTWTNATGDNDELNIGGVATLVSSSHATSAGSTTITASVAGDASSSATVISAAAWGP
jgi:hypothetical protein